MPSKSLDVNVGMDGIMIQDQRAFFGAIDISLAVNDYRTSAAPFVYSTGNYVYVGGIFPFNNLWIEMGTANANAATVSVDMWFGHQWISAVDVLDETSGMTTTGRLQWNTDINKGWDREQYSKDVTGLPASSKIYEMYWLRLSWDASFSVGTTVKYLGQKFSNDTILYSFYPDLNNAAMKTGFATGKTTWDEQHYMAAEHIVRDLKKRSIIKARQNLLDWVLLQDASCHKVAEIIYGAFGKPYLDQRKEAVGQYEKATDIRYFNTDLDSNGRLTQTEREFRTGFLTR